jgi:hypothetical protein
VLDDSPDDFVDLSNLEEQSEESCQLFDELFGNENDASFASIECCGDNPPSGTLAIINQWNQSSDWAF